jgi:hypothetical protein
MIGGWRLDTERLAAVIAEVAPGVPIVDTRAGPAAQQAGQGPRGARQGTDEPAA